MTARPPATAAAGPATSAAPASAPKPVLASELTPMPQSAPVPRPAPPSEPLPLASLRRRLAAFVYEGVLLFGVVTFTGLVYAGVFQQRHALSGRLGLQLTLLAVLGAYFVGFWSHGGQTVAMKAWHVRLLDAAGRPVGVRRAFVRWTLSWLWFAPALAAAWLSGVPRGGATLALVLSGLVAYALLVRLRPDRQFWHDAVCGTRLVDVRAAPSLRPGRRASAQSAR